MTKIYKKSKYQLRREAREKEKVVQLYKEGYSTRQIEKMIKALGIDKSHMWVYRVVKEKLSP